MPKSNRFFIDQTYQSHDHVFMVHIFILIAIVLICGVTFYNLIVFDSRPLISFSWIIGGSIISLFMVFLFPRLRKLGLRYLVAQYLMIIFLFVGFGFLAKAQLIMHRFKEISRFANTQAQLISCRAGEESPGRYRRPKGAFFPIWTYQYSVPHSSSVIASHSESLSNFSVRNHQLTRDQAEAECKKWNIDETREIFFDPNSPELSLMEIPQRHSGNTFLFLGAIFLIIPLGGWVALYRATRSSMV